MSKDDPRSKYCVPTGGIYKTPSQWPAKSVKKLIMDRKVSRTLDDGKVIFSPTFRDAAGSLFPAN